ncbi:hypothetical protein GCM10009557_76290 [Virgisporangium ochraceum]|uniref:Uncharacterized protein n=1 Tax=Virgisporangium ochraceum TaxID=65505 RepID=A0A8J4A001_9ACTN|nr:hypothetical protein [Virgisporangium ochraceum]GIJ70595.1 hypothetical protein Voc01_055120 [Virgisporangium ochraceum]
MTEFEERVRATLAEVRSHPAFRVDLAVEGSVTAWLTGPGHMLDTIRTVAGIDFGVGMGRNFHRFDGLGLAWSAVGDRSIGGEFWLTNLAMVCVGRVPDHVTAAQWPGSRRPASSRLDAYDPVDCGEHTLYGFDGAGYRGYLDAMLRTRGFLHWQYLYADPADPWFSGPHRPDLRRHVDFLAAAFPDEDFSDLATRARNLATFSAAL